MSADDSRRAVLSKEELSKEQHRKARQQAKERWATDPRYLAMKAAAKEQRRAAYQVAKARRKAVALEQKARVEAARETRRKEARAAEDEKLWKLVVRRGKCAAAKS